MERLESLQAMRLENPQDPFIQYAIALELAKNNVGTGLEAMKSLLALFPEYLPAFEWLAHTYLEMGNEQESLVHAKAALQLALAQANKKAIGEMRMILEEIGPA